MLRRLLKLELIRVPLRARTKGDAVDAMVDVLADGAAAGDREQLRAAIWKREAAGSTGIGYGVAIPHAKTASCRELCLAAGLTEDPIEFGSIDGLPVRLVFLMASPLDGSGPHVKALARISRVLMNAGARDRALAAGSPAALRAALTEPLDKPALS